MRLVKFGIVLPMLLVVLSRATADHEASGGTSIVFSTVGRSNYAFDIFTLPTKQQPNPSNELQITDGNSVNFNGHFPSPSSTSLLSLLHNQTLLETPENLKSPGFDLIYVTERDGSSNIFYDTVYYGDNSRYGTRSRSALEIPTRVQVQLLKGKKVISMKDRPSVSGEYLVYVSTHENSRKPRRSWAAVYSTELRTGLTRRLSPRGIADFSPAVSPSGVYTAVASYGERGWNGEVEGLTTDIYIFLTRDGTQRVKIVEHGGWPSWMDDSTLFFHRRSEVDEWISVYKATLPSQGPISIDSVIVERVTPPGFHAFTPATSPGNKEFIAVATRRPTSNYRHIELFDLVKSEFTELTRLVSPKTHHYNPFLSYDSTRIGYHRCRGAKNEKDSSHLLLENLQSPEPEISLFRIAGRFPSFSPHGDRIAYVNFPGLYVVNQDGSNYRQVYSGMAFATAWDPIRPGVVYTGAGPIFASESAEVDIIAVNVDDDVDNFKKLTTNGKNSGFPAVSPDGKWVVFRSGRTGHKNLYIMDAVEGESGGLYRLTEGPWSDTMCNWSPDGNWIAFASDRENPGAGSFSIFLIHPNGTGLRKLIQSGSGGRANHPWFSPDSKRIAFTSDYAGLSAEPISNPHHFQPYGDIFTIKLDGSDLKRMTHNSYEDGTPCWGPKYMKPLDVPQTNYGPRCSFEDCHFLNTMPNHGEQATKANLSKIQCNGA